MDGQRVFKRFIWWMHSMDELDGSDESDGSDPSDRLDGSDGFFQWMDLMHGWIVLMIELVESDG